MKPKTFIIGEIGINHNGDLNIAKKLIDIAACAGFDAVKFQKRDPDTCVPEKQKQVLRQTPWGQMPYIDYKKRIEFTGDQYDEIDVYCFEKGISWSASPWDMNSARFLNRYNLTWVKIASASITDLKLVNYCAKTFENLLISTGMSTMKQVTRAVDTAKKHLPQENITLLHCNSSYPAPVDELNLNVITKLKQLYPRMNVGYSGHEYGLLASMATVALGATCIERHITLDKSMWGSDQSCSLEPHAMFKLVRGIRELELALGSDEKCVTPSELAKAETLRK